MKIVMNHDQFLNWKHGNKSAIDIKLENLGINWNRKTERYIVVGLAVGGFLLNHPSMVYGLDLGKIDKLGNIFLTIVRKGGYWIVLIMSMVEISKAAMKGGNSNAEIGKIIMKNLLIYSALFLMPWLFDLVEEAFK